MLRNVELNNSEFEALRVLVVQNTGIALGDNKLELVRRRFSSRLRELKLSSYSDYVDYMNGDPGDEVLHFCSAITTNLTSFYRESHHFDYLQRTVVPELLERNAHNKRIRIWSAGCSTGEEAYTLAMILHDHVPNIRSWDIRILATDIDHRCLDKGREGIYTAQDLRGIPSDVLPRWFVRATDLGSQKRVRVKPELKDIISFMHLNLMEPWPMNGLFDLIFCRNVLIYFAWETQKKLIRRFAEKQNPSSHLFIGHSEIIGDYTDKYSLVGQTIYLRE